MHKAQAHPPFIAHNQVRMHDTDMAGILYFARQFRFANDAWEDLMEKEGLFFNFLFKENDYTFVTVHAEADYAAPLHVGDKLQIHVHIGHIGTTSFTLCHAIYKDKTNFVGSVKTVHVTIDRKLRSKIPIPENLRISLQKYYRPD